MVVISFKSKKDKEKLLEKAKKMEEYASMIVDCIEESEDDESMEEHYYRRYRNAGNMQGRYGYNRKSKDEWEE